MSDLIEGLDEEMQRVQSYAAAVSTPGTKLAGKYLKDADTYVFYEMDEADDDLPSLLVFSKATTEQYAQTRIFRLGSNVSYRTVKWVSVRRGDWPVFAKVEESDGPLLRRHIERIAPPVSDTAADSFVFRIKGCYIYVLDTPPKPTDTLTAPKLPFLAISSDRLEITEKDHQETLT